MFHSESSWCYYSAWLVVFIIASIILFKLVGINYNPGLLFVVSALIAGVCYFKGKYTKKEPVISYVGGKSSYLTQ